MHTVSISTLSPSVPFAQTLAERLLAEYGTGEGLSRVLLLLPNRRACLAMREAFLEANGGKPLLLPRIQPLGDTDVELWMTTALFAGGVSIPPAMPRARRVMLLAKLVHAYRRVAATMEHAVLLAEALADLLDEFAREHIPPERLRSVVSDAELSKHWEVSLEFLEIILTQWPEVERAEDCISGAARQDAQLIALAEYWRTSPPDFPVIAAGTTGSVPATAELLSVIARLPQGEVVLPGLDMALDDKAWEAIGATHPQYILKELLRRMGVERHHVTRDVLPPLRAERSNPDWIAASLIAHRNDKPLARESFLRAVMLPPEETGRWAGIPEEEIEDGMRGVSCVACETEEHEAAVIALRIRAALEVPTRTAMLVTPDRNLTFRVRRMLVYYGLKIDDSSGQPMTALTEAVFLQLLLECANSDGAPVPLLALLRHPLCVLGHEAVAVRELAREIELKLLRGIRPPGGFAGLLKQAEEKKTLSAAARGLLHELHTILAPFTALLRGREVAFSQLLDGHLRAAEALAGEEKLWTGHAGNKLSGVLADIVAHASALGGIDPASYDGVLSSLLGAEKYQPPYGSHPRLRILSPIEARLQQADVVILSGLNEGVWPAAVAADPWISRDMRSIMGLPLHERTVGQAAHDISLLAMAEEVVFTRAKKQGSAPSIPSRWWLRMEAVAGSERMAEASGAWAAWGREIFSAPQSQTLTAPEVSPPLEARPKRISATRVEMLMRDPYQYYAAHILKLVPLDPLDGELSVSDFGKAVHTALELYYKEGGADLAALLEAGRVAFEKHFHHTQVVAFWWPRFERIAGWCIEEDQRRRSEGLQRVLPEQTAERVLEVDGGNYLLHARIDRLEEYVGGGILAADYKTGSPPKLWEVERGVACQMLIEAWILATTYPEALLREPEYWKTSGGREAGTVTNIFRNASEKHADYIAHTEQGLRRLLRYFAQPDARYLVCPDSELAPAYNNYDHLERIAEWMM